MTSSENKIMYTQLYFKIDTVIEYQDLFNYFE